MSSGQIFISSNRWFQCEYSRYWESEIVEGIPVFYDPLNGQGALQIFSLKIPDQNENIDEKILQVFPFLTGRNLQEKMKIFLQAQKVPRSEEDIPLMEQNNQVMVAQEYQIDQTFYMAAMLQKNQYFVLAIYNCQNYPSNEEASEVGRIIRTIEILEG